MIGLEARGSWNSLYAVSPTHLPVAKHLLAFRPVVFPFVGVPTAGLRERLPAHPTFVRLLARVREFVFLETRHLREAFRAAFEFAGVRSLARVGPDVVFEVSRRREGLAALGVRTDKRTFSRVDSPVDVEVLRRVESLAAARELALTRPVRDVDLLDV